MRLPAWCDTTGRYKAVAPGLLLFQKRTHRRTALPIKLGDSTQLPCTLDEKDDGGECSEMVGGHILVGSFSRGVLLPRLSPPPMRTSSCEQNTCQQSNKYPNFNFNVSHSGNFVGITSEPVFLVGLDIVSYADFKQQATLNLLNGLSSHFTCLEWNNIISAENSNLMLAEFCRYWSLKEAYIKALGIGMGFQLNRLEFHHNSWRNIYVHVDGKESSDWKFWLFELDEKHWVSIARGGGERVREGFISSSIHEELNDEEYSSMFALPNPQFIFRRVDQLIPATDSGN